MSSETQYPRRAIVDTCVMLNVALGEHDKLPKECLERSRRLLEDAALGKLQLLVPTMSLFELCSDHELNSNSNGVKASRIRYLKRTILEWTNQCGLPTVDVTVEAAEWFKDNEAIHRLRPADAAILSCAYFANAQAVYTWDKKFIQVVNEANAKQDLGITVCEPPVIAQPTLNI